MPAINVAKSDTFEIQRQKINQIGDQIFSISQGGSDLATGNLKIGDGTIANPSLGFTTDSSLGIYKSDIGTLGFVSASKKIIDISQSELKSYKNFVFEKRFLATSGVQIVNSGTNYDAGGYPAVPLRGGTGSDASANFVVTSHVGNFVYGSEYFSGSFSNIPLSGGNGSGAIVSFDVDGIVGSITNVGSGYVPGTYTNVPLISVSPNTGSGATADIVVVGDYLPVGNITSPGSGYVQGTYQNIALLNKPTQTFVVTAIANPGTPPPNSVYQIDGATQPTLSLVVGNTYRFDLSDSSLSTHPFIFENLTQADFFEIRNGNQGELGAYFDLIILPSAFVGSQIQYDCSAHDGMGGDINIISGSVGQYAVNVTADIEIDLNGSVSSVTFTNSGVNLKATDVLELDPFTVGGGPQNPPGSGFEYTISSFAYNGTVDTVTITSDGANNYLYNQTLSAANSDLGGFGSGFEFTITSDPGIIKNFEWDEKGSNYQVGDVLLLPSNVSGITGTLKGILNGVSVTLSTLSTQVTVATTVGIVAGMEVYNTNQLDPGQVDPITTVLSVDGPTQITLSTAPISDGAGSLDFISPGVLSEVSVSSLAGLYSGLVVTVSSGTGVLPANTTILSVDSQTNTIVLSADPTTAGSCTFLFSPPFGSPSNSFSYTITNLGAVESIEISEEGIGYFVDDVLNVNPSDLVSPIDILVKNVTVALVTFTTTVSAGAFSVGDQIELSDGNSQVPGEVYDIVTLGGNIISMLISPDFQPGDEIRVVGSGNNYTIDTLSTQFRYFLDTGSGYAITPDLTFYVGNTYKFDLSDVSNTDHVFSLSSFRDGKWEPSRIENISTTLDTLSYDITVSSSSGILPGMLVSVSSGIGELNQLTEVVSVNGNTITLSLYPITSGNAVLTFSGVEYTDNVTREESSLTIKVTDTTPQLYYYCNSLDGHDNEGGPDNNEAVITIDPNNPKVFGSGFELRVLSVESDSTVSFDIATGKADFDLVESVAGNFNTITVESSVNTTTLQSNSISTSSISAQDNVAGISVSSKISVSGNLTVGTGGFSIASSTGDLNSPGYVFSNQYFNSQNKLKIEGRTISATVAENLELTPFAGRVAKVTGSTALIIPVGNTGDRPGPGVRESGAIRFNTETNQYEGYNASTTTWSSLGGVRDIDGNTYILAELNPGDNDNTLWFYNDSNNSLKLTPNFLDFRSVKKISSGKLGLPAFQEWTANTSVNIGQFLKFRNNLYEVTGAGSTATVGSEPIHTSGVTNNGTAQLTWYSSAVSPLSFTEIEELRVAPNKDAPLIVNSSLKLGGTTSDDWNTISTLVEDLTIAPNPGKRVIIKSYTHLAIPAGNNNQKNIATAIPGSIRFNTEIQQYEGYSGTNWSSLGGVRDVDGNTYIIPESAPAANENILYFYNDNLNTMQLTKTSLDFTNIDTITTSGLNNLSIDTPLVTLNSNDTTIDNRDVDRTFISTSKQFLDLGLSSGLVVDPVLRLDDQGDVYLNTTFGSGTFNGVKVLDSQLKEFELADYAIKTTTFQLAKGGAESGSFVLYDSGSRKGCKVTVVSKSSSGKRSMTEYSVIDNGTDIFHNEFGSLNTSLDQYTASFDINATNETRISLTLSNDHANGDIITFTILVQVIK